MFRVTLERHGAVVVRVAPNQLKYIPYPGPAAYQCLRIITYEDEMASDRRASSLVAPQHLSTAGRYYYAAASTISQEGCLLSYDRASFKLFDDTSTRSDGLDIKYLGSQPFARAIWTKIHPPSSRLFTPRSLDKGNFSSLNAQDGDEGADYAKLSPLERLSNPHRASFQYVFVACYFVLLYDNLTTVDEEVELMWKRKYTAVTFFFIMNRYYSVAALLVGVLGMRLDERYDKVLTPDHVTKHLFFLPSRHPCKVDQVHKVDQVRGELSEQNDETALELRQECLENFSKIFGPPTSKISPLSQLTKQLYMVRTLPKAGEASDKAETG
ncbi:hypothetical protein SCHPADRAFT_890945 [Schizopora paradoxa]|uniref:DUF6533 domain-containing protein n=1 Tax=Schizopora paradoxa TaxID=27342 RepID=A0A0H2RJW0_9AGAM|nr:hypothetical protein SCHPADRAFT_890945 [Schizopora paradoxa]